jgi:hypothetical protein
MHTPLVSSAYALPQTILKVHQLHARAYKSVEKPKLAHAGWQQQLAKQ